MRTIACLPPFKAVLVVVVLLLGAVPARAQEVRVMTSGGLAAPHLDLVAMFEQRTSQKVVTDAISTGVGQESIPSRVRRGDPVDVVMLSDASLADLIKDGRIVAESRVPLARSGVGMAVRAGAPKPDISSLDAFEARAVAGASRSRYSAQRQRRVSRRRSSSRGWASPTQIEGARRSADRARARRRGRGARRRRDRLSADQRARCPIEGIDYVGPLPAGGSARHDVLGRHRRLMPATPAGGRALIAFFSSPEGLRVMQEGTAWSRSRRGKAVPMTLKSYLLLAVVVLLAALGLAMRPVCIPISEETLAQFTVPIEQRTDRDFYVKVFQHRDGRWHQCKTWISRRLFF